MATAHTLAHNSPSLSPGINLRAVSLTATMRLPLVATVATPPATPKLAPTTATTIISPPTSPVSIVPVSTALCHSPASQHGGQEADHDVAIWQVLVELDRFVLKKDHLLLAAEIEDLMSTLEGHCQELGLDAANITHLMVFPATTPITLTTRQALYRACDDLYQDILRRQERIERWVSRIIMIAENIRESPEPFLKTTMPSMSMARIMQLEGTYRTLEKEWIERLRRFQTTVGLLRMRWIQCAYLPVDSYDHALCKLFELAQLHDSTAEFSYLQIEDPLCLSKECLASLSAKLAQLDQNYYTRQTRIKAMEHALGGLYHDFRIPDEKRVVFRNEGTVRYAAELGRELKTLQPEMEARKLYLGGERWSALTKVWDMCLVHEQERESFRSSVEQSDTTYIEKLDRIQSEIENCRVRYSKSGAVYKLMMTRRNHIEEMISIEQRASNPKRLFQPSFQLVEEEKLRKRAFVTLLKLEGSLIEALEKFESEHETEFVYDGVRYLETLQAEIDERYVNETAFAKFTPVIAAPTSSQTARIMGTQVSPSRGARSTTSNPKVSVTPPSTGRSPESSRRSNTVSAQASSTRPSPSNRAPLSRKPQAEPPKSPQRNVQQRDTCRGSLAPLGSTRSPRSLSPAASLKLRIASRSQSRDSKDSSATGSPTGPSSPSTIAPHGHKQ